MYIFMVIVIGVYPNLWGFSSAWLSPQLRPPSMTWWILRDVKVQVLFRWKDQHLQLSIYNHRLCVLHVCVSVGRHIHLTQDQDQDRVFCVGVSTHGIYLHIFAFQHREYEDDEPLFSPQFSIKSILIIHRMISALHPQYIPIIYPWFLT